MSGLVHEAAVAQTVEHYTPAWLFEALGLTYDLDPCHPDPRLPWVPAAKVYTKADDGLVQPWAGMVFLNPPYGAELAQWLERMAGFYAAGQAEGVALVFARTDTRWFHEVLVPSATAICFLQKRVKFVGPDGKPRLYPDKKGVLREGSPGVGSMLVAWGERGAAALTVSDLGAVWHLRGAGR